jgi:hypothetical protein
MRQGDRVKNLIPRPHAKEAAKPPSRSTWARAKDPVRFTMRAKLVENDQVLRA